MVTVVTDHIVAIGLIHCICQVTLIGTLLNHLVPRAHTSLSPNSLLIGSAVFVGLTVVTDTQTAERQDV